MLIDMIRDFLHSTGFASLTIKHGIMILISFILLYLAIRKEFEPLLLVPIAFGMLLANLPLVGMMAEPVVEIVEDPTTGKLLSQTKELRRPFILPIPRSKIGHISALIFMGVGP